MQDKLNNKNDLINEERQVWEDEKLAIRDLIKMDSDVVALNVGGTHHMMTERDVLRHVPGSILDTMFSGMHELKKIDDAVFLDRDGKSFQYLVNYLRNEREVFPEFMDRNDEIHFFKELEFWKIPTKYPAQNLNATRATAPPMRNTSFVSQQEKIPVHKPMPMPSQIEFESDASGSGAEPMGVALKAAKDKWNELGPLRLEEIMANSQVKIDQSVKFGPSKFN